MSEPTPKIIFNPDGEGTGDACIPNISPAERKKRMDFGILQLVIAFGVFAAMLYFGADKPFEATSSKPEAPRNSVFTIPLPSRNISSIQELVAKSKANMANKPVILIVLMALSF